MLNVAQSIKDISFSMLMDVYQQSNGENALDFWPDLSEGERLLRAEQEFYQYLKDVFFAASGSYYCIWQVDGRYVSALRLEPYEDGLLLEALETHPEYRKKGYAYQLMQEVLHRCAGTNIYSHVGKRNTASLKVHEKCGFRQIKDYAAYVDGSVNDRCSTLMHDGRREKI